MPWVANLSTIDTNGGGRRDFRRGFHVYASDRAGAWVVVVGERAPPATRTVALMYHAVGDDAGPGADPHYTVTHAGVPRADGAVRAPARRRHQRPELAGGPPGAIITFDDGHESNHRLAFPALRAAGMSADFFVNPAQVGTPGFASWSALREMAEGGMSIQSHGLDHRHYLTELSPVQLRDELKRARQEIEDHVGQPVTLLAPPGGRCPPRLADVAQEVGYSHVFSSRPGLIRADPTPCPRRC